MPRSAEGIPLILDALPDLSMTRDGAVSGMPCWSESYNSLCAALRRNSNV